jgi:hypothetical protein
MVSFSHTYELPLNREDAVYILSTTDVFADVAIGIGGSPSAEACAFITVARQQDASSLFNELLHHAKLAGQLYALCGLYLFDKPTFETEVHRYQQSAQEVATSIGCIVSGETVGELVQSTDVRNLDISRGGYPNRFASFTGCLN